jgi:hypothetical protein
MANTTIDQLASLEGAAVSNTDLLLIYDDSVAFERSLSITDLRIAVGNVGASAFTVTSTGTGDAFVVASTDATASAAPDVVFYRDSASPAASDVLGEISFRGKDSAGANTKYAAIFSSVVSPTDTTEAGNIIFGTTTNGTFAERVRIADTGTVAIGNTAPSAAAKLQIDSITQGFLPPRMSTAERNAISAGAPPEGLVVYDLTTHNLHFYNGSAWVAAT